MKEWNSPTDLAEHVGVPVRTVYAWRQAGQDPKGYRLGKHVRYHRDDIEAWLAERADAQEAGDAVA